ncbi:MAG TPA: PilZ domain-containing protein [Myxococcales bacterium]|nr:PilZ domain-containing protein [Myxococcales bacterium]
MSSTQPRYPVSMRVALSSAQGALSAEVTDVSAGGMFVRTDRVLPVGELVSAALEIPDGRQPAPVEAKVVHVAAGAPAAAARVRRGFGARFVGGDPQFRERIERYIESIERQTKVPVRLLLVARDLLYEHGWTQFAFHDAKRGYCLTGALADAAGEDRDAYRSALQTLGPRLGVRGCPFGGFGCHCAVLAWNDVSGRSRPEVVAKLDEIIHAALGHAASA